MADVALKVNLAFVHFFVLPLYKQSAHARIRMPSRALPVSLESREEHDSTQLACSFYPRKGGVFFLSARLIVCKSKKLLW